MFIDDYCESDEECVSPTALPHPSALETRSRRARFILDGLNEDAAMTLQPQKGPKQSWTWETRYTKSRTQTVADPDTTTYLCMNFPQRLQKRISDTIHSLEALARNPLFMDTLIIDEMISFYRDAIKTHRAQLLAVQNDEETSSTDMSIKLEELAGNWRTILRDIQSIQTHIQHLQSVAETRTHQRQAPAPAPARYHHHHHHHHHNPSQHRFQRGHTRQESSEVVLGPPAREILQLQNSTCEFWSRCVGMYLERTTARIDRTSTTYRLHKTIPLGQGQQGQQGGGGGALPQQLNRRLSNLTVEVAVKIQRSTSSSSVSTLALSLLSTIFFSPDGLVFAITYWWWILVTLVVPLTFVILHLWFETLASNTAFVRRRKAQRLGGGVAEDGVKETDS
ncbi:hypothetical protein SLS53_005340 [Cytospora paraplurivora]|uniref:Uncharacterized protein n=1 Tax=Cytospora paraplurivora TaxID=2898453 RepID=A0AAN9YG44_9PEZI